MKSKTLLQIEDEIQTIKSQLQAIGDMRPGSLTKQYRNRKERTGAFYQISYTHNMKSKTEYVRPAFVKDVRRQIQNYKKLKKLVARWVALGILHSQLTMKSVIGMSESPLTKRQTRKHRG